VLALRRGEARTDRDLLAPTGVALFALGAHEAVAVLVGKADATMERAGTNRSLVMQTPSLRLRV